MRKRQLANALVLAIVVMAITSCQQVLSILGLAGDTAVSSIVVSAIGGSAAISAAGGNLQLSAKVLPADATNKNIIWSVVKETGNASISDSGLLSALANGTVIAIASSKDGSGVSGSMQVAISNQVQSPIAVTSITVSAAGGTAAITTSGGTLQLSGSVLPTNATNAGLAWSVTNGTGAATISVAGLLAATSDGTVTAVASATDGSGIKGALLVSISNQAITPTLTITSPVVTKLYGVTNSATAGVPRVLPIPLDFTTNQATVEYSLNGAAYIVATSGFNLASLVRHGINTLDVRSKNSQGAITSTNPTIRFLSWDISAPEPGFGAAWPSGSTVTAPSGGVTLSVLANQGGGFAANAATQQLELANQSAYNAAANPYPSWAALQTSLPGPALPTTILAGIGLTGLPLPDAGSSSLNDWTVGDVGIAGMGGNAILAALTGVNNGNYYLNLIEISGIGYQNISSTQLIVPFGSFASTNGLGTRYYLVLIKDVDSYEAVVIDYNTITMNASSQPSSAPDIIAEIYAPTYNASSVPARLNSDANLLGVGFTGRNTTSSVLGISTFFAQYY